MYKLPKAHLSVSQIRSLLHCGFQYEMSYVLGIKSPGGMSMLNGRAFHKAVEVSNRAILEDAEIMDTDAVATVYSETFDKELERKPDDYDFKDDIEDGKTLEATKNKGIEVVSFFHESKGKGFRPFMIESRSNIEIEGIPFQIVMDLIETDKTIRDFKTSGKSPSEGEIWKTIQLPAYAMGFRQMFGESETNVALDYAVALKKEPKLVTLETGAPVDDDRIDRFRHTVITAAKQISAGIFPRNEEGMACSWCGLKDICKNKRKV